jgi:ubiquinone/menaquinone biosynthesis C-methylase UbiE
MLAQLAKRAKDLNVKLVEADIFSLPFPDSCFDSAVSRWVLPHFSNWGEALKEVARVLKPGGVIVFDFPSREHVEHALSRKSLLSKEKLGYEHSEAGEIVDPYFYYGAESQESMARVVSENGLVLKSRTPYGLLVANSLVFGNLNPIESRLKNLAFGLGIKHSKTFRKVLSSIEHEITPNLEAKFVHGSFVVATKA